MWVPVSFKTSRVFHGGAYFVLNPTPLLWLRESPIWFHVLCCLKPVLHGCVLYHVTLQSRYMWSTLGMIVSNDNTNLKLAHFVQRHCTEEKRLCFQWPLILFTINLVHTTMLPIKICKRVLFTLHKSSSLSSIQDVRCQLFHAKFS